MSEWVIASERIVFPSGVAPGWVHVVDGVIASTGSIGEAMPAARLIYVADRVVLPGLVDAHVHINQPGRKKWEGFATATSAAAAGGTTTIIDMPLNSIPPTVDAEALREKRKSASSLYVDVGFWGGAVPGNVDELAGLAAGGVSGFKAFLCDPGIEEYEQLDRPQLEAAAEACARLGLPLLVHAEDSSVLIAADATFAALTPEARRRYRTYLDSRPSSAEDVAVDEVIEVAESTGVRAHILHLASMDALPALAAAREAGRGITAETCPHYLAFSADAIPDGATEYKCAPPIREERHRAGLWQGLIDGTIDMVVSDHSPAPAELRAAESGDFGAAWGGISSLQLRLPAVWTAGQPFGVRLEDLARWLAWAPAELAGLTPRKGSIIVGADADLVVFDPISEFTVDVELLEHRHPVSPYDGMRLQGIVEATFLRGELVYERGGVLPDASGRTVERI